MIVSTDAELKAALAAAKGGETITLAAGLWPAFRSSRPRVFAEPVTLVAEQRRQTEFAGLHLGAWGGLRLQGLAIKSDASPVVNLSTAKDVALTDCLITSAKPDFDAWNNGNSGVHIRGAEGVTLENCDVQDLKGGMFLQRSSSVRIEGNRLLGLREGLNIAACDNVKILRNEIGEFQPNYAKREHPDAIQFWTNGETRGCEDVLIEGNRLIELGRQAAHGIFARNDYSTAADDRRLIRHKRFTIRRNIYYGSAKHGISLAEVEDFVVEGNAVIAGTHAGSGYARGQDDGRTSAALMPTIHIAPTSTGAVRRNLVPWLKLPSHIEAVGNYAGNPADLLDAWGDLMETIAAERRAL